MSNLRWSPFGALAAGCQVAAKRLREAKRPDGRLPELFRCASSGGRKARPPPDLLPPFAAFWGMQPYRCSRGSSTSGLRNVSAGRVSYGIPWASRLPRNASKYRLDSKV